MVKLLLNHVRGYSIPYRRKGGRKAYKADGGHDKKTIRHRMVFSCPLENAEKMLISCSDLPDDDFYRRIVTSLNKNPKTRVAFLFARIMSRGIQ